MTPCLVINDMYEQRDAKIKGHHMKRDVIKTLTHYNIGGEHTPAQPCLKYDIND